MIFGLIANLKRKGADKAIDSFKHWANKNSHELILCEELKPFSGGKLVVASRGDIASKVDILVAMGGDGTILATARAVGKIGTPVLGINLGSLGFLTQFTFEELIPALDSVVKGDFQLQERMLLKVDIDDGTELANPYALNDVVIDNGGVSRIIDINLKVNGEEIVTYNADGLVVSTPTGSTAYSLAVGGPIMHPKMEAIITAPISSFSLTTRPMIFSSNDILEISILTEDRRAGLTLDGQVMEKIDDTDTVKITRADFNTKFIIFPEHSFYKVLKNKLHWGMMPTMRR